MSTHAPSGGKISPCDQFVIIDHQGKDRAIHPRPQGGPGGTVPGGYIISAHATSSGKLSPYDQPVVIDRQGSDIAIAIHPRPKGRPGGTVP